MAIGMSSPQLASGTQRPNVVCPQLKTGLSRDTVARDWQGAGTQGAAAFLNKDCFGDRGDQTPGNAPRYFSSLRVDGIHNVDMNIYKSFVPGEGLKLDVRAEMFNFFNHPRSGSQIRRWEMTHSGPLLRWRRLHAAFLPVWRAHAVLVRLETRGVGCVALSG
jgi:hypothetical protein